MRKTCLMVLLASVIVTSTPNTIVNAEPQETHEKPAYDALLTLLNSNIHDAITNYYGYPKQYALFWSKVLDIKRESEGSYSFIVKVKVVTFEHAHSNPFGTETIIFNVNPSGVKLISYEHKGDEWEHKIAKFKDEVLDDIIKGFILDLSSFQKYEYRQLAYQSEQGHFQTLFKICEEIQHELMKDYKAGSGYKNFIDPITFVKGDRAYILFKKADGTNYVYSLTGFQGEWKVMKRESKQGKVMPQDLLWYMYKHLGKD